MDVTLTTQMQLSSPAFKDGESIPPQYSCKGDNINPPLTILNTPENAKSLALIMHDPDAPVGDYLHWIVWDIRPSTQAIGASSVPVGAVQGPNDSNKNQYTGPCPPKGTGTHRYIFELYALDLNLNLAPNTSRQKLQEAMKGHVVEQAILTGIFSADS
jgi:Raf kinase inhibitor-like YbhB/YbcL family protein